MGKPWFSCSLVLVCLVCTSCLELSVSVNFTTSTTGQVRVDALTLRSAQGIQVADGNDKVTFPTTRAEWQTVVNQVPGSTLVSWSGVDEDLGFRSTTVLGFTTARALEGLFVVFKQKLTLLQDIQGKWTLTFQPRVPRVTEADAATRKLWSDLWGTKTWSFSFSAPGQPASERLVRLSDLALDRPVAEWTLTW